MAPDEDTPPPASRSVRYGRYGVVVHRIDDIDAASTNGQPGGDYHWFDHREDAVAAILQRARAMGGAPTEGVFLELLVEALINAGSKVGLTTYTLAEVCPNYFHVAAPVPEVFPQPLRIELYEGITEAFPDLDEMDEPDADEIMDMSPYEPEEDLLEGLAPAFREMLSDVAGLDIRIRRLDITGSLENNLELHKFERGRLPGQSGARTNFIPRESRSGLS